MSDLIERQAAIDEIEERKNANGYRNVAVISELNRIEGYIMRLPSVQPEIIHCRECKYAHLTYSDDCKYCDKWLDDLDGDFYCGYAEKRTDEGD